MGRPRAFEETEILDRAIELFWERGYEATSIADLEEQLGVGRQSLYNVFGGKRALFARALERYSAQANEQVAAVLLAPDAGMAELREYFRSAVRRLTEKGGRKGCLVANSILESPENCPEADAQCRNNQKRMRKAFQHVLKSAVAKGELAADFDVAAGANLLLAQVYGLTVMSKAGASPKEMNQSAEALIAGL